MSQVRLPSFPLVCRFMVLSFCCMALGCSSGKSSPSDAGLDVADGEGETFDATDESNPDQGSGDSIPDGNDLGPDENPILPLPNYPGFQLQARLNPSGNPSGTFNIEPNWDVSDEDIAINDNQQVSFRLVAGPNNAQAVWAGQNGQGQIVFQSLPNALLSNVAVGLTGRVVFDQSFNPEPGIYLYDLNDHQSRLWSTEPVGANRRGSLSINNQNQVGCLAAFNGGRLLAVITDSQSSAYIKETALDKSSPYSYLFDPDLNNQSALACKVRRGPGGSEAQPDEIRIFDHDASSKLIAVDRDGDPGSPFAGFDNAVAQNDSGQVAFIATLADSGKRTVMLSDGSTSQTIATENEKGVLFIGRFAPDLSNSGVVVFRAKNDAGMEAIWIGNGKDLMPLVVEHDPIDTDQGQARIDQSDPSAPVFGGRPGINNNDDVVFYASLTSPDNDQEKWGTGIFVAVASH